MSITDDQWQAHIRQIADSRCRDRHPAEHAAMILSGDGEKPANTPCDNCVERTKNELEQKRLKAHGEELSPEEAAAVRKEFGSADTDPDINPESAR